LAASASARTSLDVSPKGPPQQQAQAGPRASCNAAPPSQRSSLVSQRPSLATPGRTNPSANAATAPKQPAGQRSSLAASTQRDGAPREGAAGAGRAGARALRFADEAGSEGGSDDASEVEPTEADLRLDEALLQYEGVALDGHLLQARGQGS
jgi:hypothetical protein